MSFPVKRWLKRSQFAPNARILDRISHPQDLADCRAKSERTPPATPTGRFDSPVLRKRRSTIRRRVQVLFKDEQRSEATWICAGTRSTNRGKMRRSRTCRRQASMSLRWKGLRYFAGPSSSGALCLHKIRRGRHSMRDRRRRFPRSALI